MSRYYADYVPPTSSRDRDRSPLPRRPDYDRERDRVREYESRRYERRSRSPDPRYERRASPTPAYERRDRGYEREREREHYGRYEDHYGRRETAYDDRRYAESRRSPPPYERPREETKKSEYEIEYDPKTRTFQGPGVKGVVPQPAYTSSKSLGIPKATTTEDSSSSKRRKARKGPIVNYFDPDIMPNEKVICPYNSAHIVQRKRLQGHILYCRKKFPNTDLKICPLNVLHVVKEDELESHILNCPDREIVKYLSFEPDFGQDSPPHQGFIESTENWDDDVVIDYDPNIQIEKFRKIAEEADKEGYIAPVELPTEAVQNILTSPNGIPKEKAVEQVEINGEVIRIKREKTENEEVNENETMALLEEELKETERIVVLPPISEPRRYEHLPEIRVKKEWSPIPRRRSPSPRRRKTPVRRFSPSPPPRPLSSRRRSPSLRRRSPSPRRRRTPSPRRRSPSTRRRSPSPRRRSPSPRRRSPGYYKILSPQPRIKREPDDNGYIHSRDRFDTSRRYSDRSPPPVFRVKEELNDSRSRHDPYLRYEDDHSRKPKYDDYYARKDYYDDKSKSTKDLYSKYEDYGRPRYEERRRSPSPKAYPAAYRPRSRSPVDVRYERPRSRSPRSRSIKYDRERSPRFEKDERYERRKTPPLAPKSSKDYYEFPTYGSMIEKEKNFRKNPDRRIKTEKAYSPPRSYKTDRKDSRKTPDDEEMIYSRQA
ncbi:GTSF1.2 family protein [Megaselia abdita]